MSIQYDQKKSYNHQPEDTPQVSPDGFAKLGEKLDQNLISPSPPSSELPLFSFQSCQAPFGAQWTETGWSEVKLNTVNLRPGLSDCQFHDIL